MMYTEEICRVCILKTLTTRIIVAFFILTLTQQSFGQFNDNFSDGDFTMNPAWVGNESKFVVSGNQLKLQAPEIADFAYLSVSTNVINDASWEFVVKFEFDPSSTNYMRVYLVSDNLNLSSSLNGYFVMLGNTADEISLYRQTGTTRTRIVDGEDGRLNLSTSSTKVKVTRDASGIW